MFKDIGGGLVNIPQHQNDLNLLFDQDIDDFGVNRVELEKKEKMTKLEKK